MLHKFIQTTNYINCLEAMKELARLPRDMEKMGLFYGNAGRGKSLIIEKLAIDEGAALVRTLGSWTPKQMMMDICEALEIMDTGTTSTLQHRIIDELAMSKRILIIETKLIPLYMSTTNHAFTEPLMIHVTLCHGPRLPWLYLKYLKDAINSRRHELWPSETLK